MGVAHGARVWQAPWRVHAAVHSAQPRDRCPGNCHGPPPPSPVGLQGGCEHVLTLADVRRFDPGCDPPFVSQYPLQLSGPSYLQQRACEVGRGAAVCGDVRGARASVRPGPGSVPAPALHHTPSSSPPRSAIPAGVRHPLCKTGDVRRPPRPRLALLLVPGLFQGHAL